MGIDLNSLGVTPDEVAAALRRERRKYVRRRLVAIGAILAGKSRKQAQEAAGACLRSVESWLKQVRQGGLEALVADRRGGRQINSTLERRKGPAPPRPPKVNADPAALRELAAPEKNPRVRKRMLALACVAEGKNAFTAAVSTKVAHGTVLASVKRFQQEGIAGLQDRKIAGRPCKLSKAQLQELGLAVSQRPEMSYAQLRDLVLARFHVRYAHASLKRLLETKLATVWSGSRKKLRDGLKLAELQAAMAGATHWRPKDRLMALIQLAEGEDAKTVARSRGVHLDTLRKWANRYRCSGIEGLQSERDSCPSKLSLEQGATLTKWIMAQPEIDEDKLCAQVKARFGVSYSAAPMRRLARRARSGPSGQAGSSGLTN